MDLQLADKVIRVTGGAKGIGEGIVNVLAAEGAIPVVIGRKEADNQQVVDALEAAGKQAFQVVAELTRPADSEKAVNAGLTQFGRIDGLVNNAGVNITSKTADTGQGNTSAYAAANGGRNALTRKWAVELLKYGIRVNAVVVAECWTPLYERWIQSLPNPTDKLASITAHIPLENRMTTAEEIANTTAFLLSSRSSHTTGQLVYVDGGYVHLDRALANAD